MTGRVVPAVVQNEKNLKKRRSIALPVIRLEEAASGPGSHHGLHREEHRGWAEVGHVEGSGGVVKQLPLGNKFVHILIFCFLF